MRLLLLTLLLPLLAASAYAQSNTPTNPTKAACGLPAQGTIVASVTYTLTANCTQTGWLEIKTSETSTIKLVINGNNKTITNSSYVNYWARPISIISSSLTTTAKEPCKMSIMAAARM